MPIDVSDRNDMASENLLWPSKSLNTYELVRGMDNRVFNGCGDVCDDVNCTFGGARFVVSRLPAHARTSITTWQWKRDTQKQKQNYNNKRDVTRI